LPFLVGHGGFAMKVRSRLSGSAHRLLRVIPLGLLLGALSACETSPKPTGLQVWQKGWPGAPSPTKAESIQLETQTIECGVDPAGDFVFLVSSAPKGLQLPDGSTIRADTYKVILQRTKESSACGIGPYVLFLKLGGEVYLKGPFPPYMEAWLGDSFEKGETVPLDIPTQKGPLVIRCPLDLVAVWATGKAMIFGTTAKAEEKGPGTATPPEGSGTEGKTPPEGEGDGTTPPGTPGEGGGEGEKGGTPGETPGTPSEGTGEGGEGEPK
jgi:hypothetical protein